jgi:hypothetical protein
VLSLFSAIAFTLSRSQRHSPAPLAG